MQTIHPSIERLEKKLKSRRGKRRMSVAQYQKNKERLMIAEWKHKGTPGWAR